MSSTPGATGRPHLGEGVVHVHMALAHIALQMGHLGTEVTSEEVAVMRQAHSYQTELV